MSARGKRLDKAQMRVLFQVPFFAPGVAKLPVEFTQDPAIQTACTDGKRILWSEKFFDSLTDQQLVTVLCHEVSHCMLGHNWRAPVGADWDLWNQAVDHAVNLMLMEFSEKVTAKNLADPFPFPEPKEAFCADPKFKGLAEEVIYNRLNNQPKGKGSKSGSGSGKPGPGSMPSFGQISKPAGAQADPAVQKKMAADWTATLIQAAQMAKGRGELPVGMERLVGEVVNPKVDWRSILQSWIREQCSDDWDWLTPAIEYSDCGFILPSLRADKVGTLVFATDTSGSINQELLAQFQGEKQQALDDMRPKKLVDIYCDAHIHKVEEYTVGDTITRQCPGGGGTSFVPVWKHVAKMDEVPKAIVYLTDLQGDFGTDPGVPVLWVTWTKGGTAPFGQVIEAL